MGEPEKSAAEAREALELRPDHPLPNNNLASAYIDLGRIDEAESVVRAARERGATHPFQSYLLYAIAFLRGDEAGMEAQRTTLDGTPGEMFVLQTDSATALYGGRLSDSRELFRRSVQIARRFGFEENAAEFTGRAAVGEALLGHGEEARRLARQALEISTGLNPRLMASLALGIAGATAEAETLLDELAAERPEDTLLTAREIPTRRAVLAVERGEPEAALELLRSAEPYDGLALETIWVRGQALLAAGRPEDAVAEFQRLVDRESVDPMLPWHSVARLGLARAHAEAGNRDQAIAAYAEFLDMWKNADPDLALYQQAQAEYDALLEMPRG